MPSGSVSELAEDWSASSTTLPCLFADADGRYPVSKNIPTLTKAAKQAGHFWPIMCCATIASADLGLSASSPSSPGNHAAIGRRIVRCRRHQDGVTRVRATGGRESFSADGYPHGKRVSRKTTPDPFRRFHQKIPGRVLTKELDGSEHRSGRPAVLPGGECVRSGRTGSSWPR